MSEFTEHSELANNFLVCVERADKDYSIFKFEDGIGKIKQASLMIVGAIVTIALSEDDEPMEFLVTGLEYKPNLQCVGALLSRFTIEGTQEPEAISEPTAYPVNGLVALNFKIKSPPPPVVDTQESDLQGLRLVEGPESSAD